MTIERKPHKWAETIKAWADGKPVQYKNLKDSDEWVDYKGEGDQIPMLFGISYFEWRVKPECVVIERCVSSHPEKRILNFDYDKAPNLRLIFETGKLVKAEVI